MLVLMMVLGLVLVLVLGLVLVAGDGGEQPFEFRDTSWSSDFVRRACQDSTSTTATRSRAAPL